MKILGEYPLDTIHLEGSKKIKYNIFVLLIFFITFDSTIRENNFLFNPTYLTRCKSEVKMTKKNTIRAYNNQIIKTYVDKSKKYKGFIPKYKVQQLEESNEVVPIFNYYRPTLKSVAVYEQECRKFLLEESENFKETSSIRGWRGSLAVKDDAMMRRLLEEINVPYCPAKEVLYFNNLDSPYWKSPAEKKFGKLKAQNIGLNYVSAVINHPDTNPLAFKIWEEMSWEKTDNYRGNSKPQYLMKNSQVLYEKGKGFGAWDAHEVWGVAPKTIKEAWFLAGAKDSPKFRAILRHLKIVKQILGRYDYCSGSLTEGIRKNSSAEETIAYLKGKRFILKWSSRYIDKDGVTQNYIHLKYKDYVRIGKVASLPVRKALITNMTYKKVIVHDENGKLKCSKHFGTLNYAYAKEVMLMSKKEQAKMLPNKAAWFHLYGRCAFEGGNKDIPSPNFLSQWTKAASAFVKMTRTFGKNTSVSSMLMPSFNLAALFGSEAEICKFVTRKENVIKSYNNMNIGVMGYSDEELYKWANLKGKSTISALMDESIYVEYCFHDAGQFALPKKPFLKEWKDFVMKYPEALKYSSHWNNVESDLGRTPKSMTELRNIVAKYHYDNVSNYECSVACYEAKVSQSTFESYQTLYRNPKVAESCPHVNISRNGYVFRKLQYNDPKGALLGIFTNCCQHLNGAASACARHGVTEESSAFYVVEKEGKIIAQSWAWRSKKGDLVFDSIECVSSNYAIQLAELYLLASQDMLGKLGVNRVLVGSTSYGITSKIKMEINPTSGEIFSEEMVVPCSYMDGHKQWLLTENKEPLVKLKKKELNPSISKPEINFSINSLLEGSDVYCEHCEAEVHPDCEICPSCSANIAEWV